MAGMTVQYHNLIRRRSWTPEKLAADRARRLRQRAHLLRYVPHPISQRDTIALVHEEALIVLEIRRSGQMWHPLWEFLNRLVGTDAERVRRPVRQKLLAVVDRMITEGKVVRHRPSNSISLAPWLR